MSKFQAGYTAFKKGIYPADLASGVGYEVLYVIDTAVKLKGFEATVSEHLLESIADRAKRRETKQSTKQVGGTHYGEGVDVFDFSLQRKHDCLQHSAIKYIDRHKLKNGEEDIRKAISVLERILKEQYIEQETTK